MSNPPDQKHPWAKFKAKPSAPRLPTERAGSRAFAPKEKSSSAASLFVAPKRVEPAMLPVAPSARVAEPVPKKAEVKPAAKTEAQRPMARAEARPTAAPRTAPVKGKEPPPAASAARVTMEAKPEAKAEAAPLKPVMSAGLASVLGELEKADVDPAVVKRVGRERDASPRQRWWVWYGLTESVQNYRRMAAQVRAWWRMWRTGSSARVLLAFVVIYGLLAAVRKPSDVAAERSRIGEEIAFLQGFLKSYCAAGGPVLTMKPHGGAELYPRGIVLKGEVLNAFARAPVGGVFAVQVTAPEWNPLEAFYDFPSVYAGGTYFHLERKINFPLYRSSFLIRKGSEREGAILLTQVERAL